MAAGVESGAERKEETKIPVFSWSTPNPDVFLARRLWYFLINRTVGGMNMKCPACGTALTPMTIAGMIVNACQGGCGGIWFDRFELSKVDEPTQSAGELLLHIERNPAIQVDTEKRPQLKCPECGVPMMRHFFSVKKQVLVDECPECDGTWLDA